MTCENYFHQNGIETLAWGVFWYKWKKFNYLLVFRGNSPFLTSACLLASAPPALMQEAASSVRPMDAMPPSLLPSLPLDAATSVSHRQSS